jgi:two-component system, LuxR family, response regulator FixJ
MPIIPDEPAVHVIDDDEAVRDSLAFLFETAKLPVRTYGSGLAFLEVAGDIRSGCVLTDVRMPDIDGLALQLRLVELKIALAVIIMTGHADVPIAVQALKAGAVDFIEKPFDDTLLLAAVRRAIEISAQARAHADELSELSRRMGTLTPREREVLVALVAGNPNKAIANQLGTSPRTIEVHRARVIEKMGARSLSELVRMALRLGVA